VATAVASGPDFAHYGGMQSIRFYMSGFAVALVSAFAACGAPAAGPCDKTPPEPQCAVTCDPNANPSSCPVGFHCRNDNKCYAFCTLGGTECGDGLTCSDDGRCISNGIDAAPQPDSNCASVNFTAKPVTPSIQLVLDRSGSMDLQFGNTSRWEALKTALVSATGVVQQLQAKAYFGATIFPGSTACESFDQTASRVLNANTNIKSLLDANGPNLNTPTGPALQMAIQSFAGAGAPPAGSPPIIVLATDGIPNICGDGGATTEGQQLSVAAATAAHAAGIDVYVLALSLDAGGISQMQEVANAGRGVTNATVFKGDNPAQLKAAFDTIIGGVVSCQLTLSGNIDPVQGSQGTVRLNGRTLMFGTEWTIVDMNTIELVGAACTELKNLATPTVTANFPCGVVVN
jgi:hypothetical protein